MSGARRDNVRFDRAALKRLLFSREVAASAVDIGEAIAADARATAPVGNPSKGGAASIAVRPGGDSSSPYADVSWDEKHFYMQFQERRRPFLLPAALRNRSRG